MKARALVLAASLLAAVGVSPLTVRAAPIDWVLATMTVTQPAAQQSGGSFSIGEGSGELAPGEAPAPRQRPPHLDIAISGRDTGDHSTVLGSAAAFDGRGFSDVFDSDNGGFHVQTTKDLGSVDLQLTNKRTSGFVFITGASAFGSVHTLTMLAFIANGTIDSFHVDASGGTPQVFTGSGSRAIGAADPESSGVAVDASVAAAGASTLDVTSPLGLVGGPDLFECTHCSVSWKTPTGATGQVDQQTMPFIFLPVPIPVPPLPLPSLDSISGDDGFFGPAGAWSWSWTGVNVRPEMSQTIAAAYAPVGDLWKLFVPSAAIVAKPEPAPQPSKHQTKVLAEKKTRKTLAATGVSAMPAGWLFLAVAAGLGTILRRRPRRAGL